MHFYLYLINTLNKIMDGKKKDRKGKGKKTLIIIIIIIFIIIYYNSKSL